MKRRTFTLAAAAAVMSAADLAALSARAQDAPDSQNAQDSQDTSDTEDNPFEGSKGYKTIEKPAPSNAPAGKIDVIEFFAYSCPHCMRFEPVFATWRESAPKDVAARRVHVGFSAAFEPLQRIYYSLRALGAPETIHPKVFSALQVLHLRLDQPKVLFPWIASQGIDRANFEQAYNSSVITDQIQRANQTQNAYMVESTPSLGIAGRFYVDPSYANASADEAQAFASMLKITNTLIAQARKGA